jgi:hypothetical protein
MKKILALTIVLVYSLASLAQSPAASTNAKGGQQALLIWDMFMVK